MLKIFYGYESSFKWPDDMGKNAILIFDNNIDDISN